MATGPAQPASGDETYWEADTQAAAPASEVPPTPEPEADSTGVDLTEYARVPAPRPWRLWHVMFLVASAAVFVWLAMLLFAVAWAIIALAIAGSIALGFAGVMGLGVIRARRRYARQDSLLSVLAIAAERNMPLAPAVVAFADQFRGLSYRRIMNLAAQLNWGTALPVALERAGRFVSRDATLLAWVGDQTGTLPRALRMAAAARSTMLPIWTAIAGSSVLSPRALARHGGDYRLPVCT